METFFNILVLVYFSGIIASVIFVQRKEDKKKPLKEYEWGLILIFSLLSWLMFLIMIIGSAFRMGEKEEEIYARNIE
jgi:hypothetical protein